MKRLSRGLLLCTFVTATTALADVAPLGPMPAPQSSAQHEAARRRLEALRAQAAALASAAASAGVPLPPASAMPSAAPSALPPQLQLTVKWAEQIATRGVRRQEHQHALIAELGSQLADPAVNAELVLHARRVAELGRAEFLAKNARSGAAQAKLLARIKKLSAQEDARHHAALAKLKRPAAPAPSSAPAAGGSAPVPSASGAHR